MRAELAGPARLLRPSEGWAPVGPVLPPLDDGGMHDPFPETGSFHWHLPAAVDAQPGDVLLVRERAVLLIDRCGPRHHATIRLRDYMLEHYPMHFAEDWLSRRQVWSARVLSDDELRALRTA